MPWLFLFLALVCGKPVTAQVTGLREILDAIEKNNPSLRKYDSRIAAYNGYASGARALDPPQVGAGFFMTPYNPAMWKPDGMNDGMGSFMLSAEQMFMNRKKRDANAVYMKSMSGADAEMKNAMRNEMFAMAKMAYYDWVVMTKKLAVISESEQLLDFLIRSAELRYTYGMDKLNAYYKAKAMLADMQGMRIMTLQDIAQAKLTIRTLMNSKDTLSSEIDTAVVIKNYESAQVDTAGLARRRSDLKVLEQNILVLRSRQNYERARLKPDFGIRYDHMIGFGNQPQQFTLMGMVTIPIAPWSSQMYKASVAGVNSEVEAVRLAQQALINEAGGQLLILREKIKAKKQQIDIYRNSIIGSIRRNYETALLAYEQNREELFMVLDAWQNLKAVQLTHLDLLAELLSLQVQYEKQLEIP